MELKQTMKDENGNIVGYFFPNADGKTGDIRYSGDTHTRHNMTNPFASTDAPINSSFGRESRKSGPTSNETDVSAKKETARLKTLSYPSTGGNNHYVRFNINVNEESKLITRTLVQSSPVNNIEQMRINRDLTSGEGAGTYGGVAMATAGASTGLMLKKLLGAKGATVAAVTLATAGAIGGNIGGEAIATNVLKMKNKLRRLKNTITLYSPGNISANYGMRYNDTDDGLANLLQQDQYDKIKNGISGTNAASSASTMTRILSNTIDTVGLLSRTARNNKKDLMFKEVANRTFDFVYTFAPKNAKEAKEVDDIIYQFKYFAHPELLDNYANFLYLYPAEFDIEYGFIDSSGNDKANTYINKISSCVLEVVNVNYSSGESFQSLENGEPIITTLQLRFKEIETLHQGRIEQGY